MKVYKTLAKYQKTLLGLAVFVSLSAVSITIGGEGVKLSLGDYPVFMLLLVVLGLGLSVLYIQVDKHQIETLSNSILSISEVKEECATDLLQSLTKRQEQIYQLMLAGKSNKEIIATLFIEQSTLKSHINQIYKKLKVKNRKTLIVRFGRHS